MDKKPSAISNKSNKTSDRFIDRILYRFKSNKRSSRGSIPNAPLPVEYCPPAARSIEPPEDEEEFYADYQYDWNYRRVTLEDMKPFCEQLGKFLQYVQNIQEVTYFTFDYPWKLQNRLERDSNELESIYHEVKAAVINIDRITKQRKAVCKEKSHMKKTLKRLREDEAREMENVLQTYDKTMFQRWENIKNCYKPEHLEHLLNDVKNKQQALDNLQTLITRKLSTAQFFAPIPPIPCPDVPSTAKDKTSNDKSANATDNKQTTAAVKRHNQSSPTMARYRRRRHDGSRAQDNNAGMARMVGPQNIDNVDMPLVPYPIMPMTSGPSSNHGLFHTGANNWSPATDSNNNNTAAEFHTEMRSVLQALFGDVPVRPSTPSPTATTINRGRDTSTASDTDTEIELYTIQRPPQPQ